MVIKMSLANYNKGNFKKIEWNVDTEGFEYMKPSQLEQGKEYSVKGIFITKDNGYGQGANIISDGFFISVPSGQVDTMKEILADDNAVEIIKLGAEKCTVRRYKSKNGNIGYSIDFI